MKVLELFAGVGGFRIGLENADRYLFQTKWSNQWEPAKKTQDAFEVYNFHYPYSKNYNVDIAAISDDEFKKMDADLIVGGFPCQDYSVARSKKNELGIEGKKGVLFWEIIRATENIKPKYLILENVDRLLKAPSKQRGRDFAVMLGAFNSLGYSVEWRVINAAEYGRAQKRRRVFFFVYRNDCSFGKSITDNFKNHSFITDDNYLEHYLTNTGLFATQFPVEKTPIKNRITSYELQSDLVELSNNFKGSFWNSGIMRFGKVFSMDLNPILEKSITLGEILLDHDLIDNKYVIKDTAKIEKFLYLRGPKKIERTSSDGHTYTYSEGGMSPTDSLDSPGRTMLTSEGTVNRSTHFISQIEGQYRLLTPIEAERLQDFPDDWTKFKMTADGNIVEVPDKTRMFFMGNALVTEIVKRIGLFISHYERNNAEQ